MHFYINNITAATQGINITIFYRKAETILYRFNKWKKGKLKALNTSSRTDARSVVPLFATGGDEEPTEPDEPIDPIDPSCDCTTHDPEDPEDPGFAIDSALYG
ncbi:MAG: hypothetical protein ACK5M7_10420, partial [Draconibacterium sp.]